MNSYLSIEGIELLRKAQLGSKFAEQELIELIRDNFMGRRIGRYLHRNRLVEDEDIKQEFMIGVALSIDKASLTLGDPIEYLIKQGVYRVRSYLRKHIVQNTSQVCSECGYTTRLNRIGNDYVCKRCGSTSVTPQELNDYNELVIFNTVDNKMLVEDDVIDRMLVDKFEETLQPNTNIHNLYTLLIYDGINRDNPQIKNYIKEISKLWGGCSDQNVIQNMEKLKKKVYQFIEENDLRIHNGCFVLIEDLNDDMEV